MSKAGGLALPRAAMRPPRTASHCAAGFFASTVWMVALTRTRSAGASAALAGEPEYAATKMPATAAGRREKLDIARSLELAADPRQCSTHRAFRTTRPSRLAVRFPDRAWGCRRPAG